MANPTPALAKMIAFALAQPTELLCQGLEVLAAKDKSDEDRVVDAVIIDVLVQRYPAVAQAFDAWAGSTGDSSSTSVVAAAARAAAKATGPQPRT